MTTLGVKFPLNCFRSYENMKEYVANNKKEVAAVYESEWKYMNTKIRKTDEAFSSLGYL